MTTQITNYQCPACTGPLHFDGGSGKLECEYCGSAFEVAEIEALYAEKEAAAAEAGGKAEEKRAAEAAEEAWTPAFSADWGEDAAKMRAYNCPSCGAELICEETTAATACPYCGNLVHLVKPRFHVHHHRIPSFPASSPEPSVPTMSSPSGWIRKRPKRP